MVRQVGPGRFGRVQFPTLPLKLEKSFKKYLTKVQRNDIIKVQREKKER